MNYAWGEGLVDDISEGLGHLDCIFCPSSCDEMNGKANIGRRKFGWTSTSGLLKLRTLFGAKSGDGGCMNTSCGCNGVTCGLRVSLYTDRFLAVCSITR